MAAAYYQLFLLFRIVVSYAPFLVAMEPIDCSLDELVKSRPRSRRDARGGVRAEGEPARDGVSADGGKRPGRKGGKGRGHEGGKGTGPNSRMVSAGHDAAAGFRGRLQGAHAKSASRPKRTKQFWQPKKVQPGVSADNQDPPLARGQSGEKTPTGGGT